MTYEVQVRTVNGVNTSDWSPSGTGTPRTPPPQPPPNPAPTPTQAPNPAPAPPFTGGGGFALPAPPAPPRPATDFQAVGLLFSAQRTNGALVRIWRLDNVRKGWTFYDPRPLFARFNTLGRVNLASDPPPILVVNVSSPQQFRGYTLYKGWNYIPVESGPPPRSSFDYEKAGEVFAPLVEGGALERVWRLDGRTQVWQFFDPDPAFAAFNTLDNINLGANPPVVVVIRVSRTVDFRGQRLYRGWNHMVLR